MLNNFISVASNVAVNPIELFFAFVAASIVPTILIVLFIRSMKYRHKKKKLEQLYLQLDFGMSMDEVRNLFYEFKPTSSKFQDVYKIKCLNSNYQINISYNKDNLVSSVNKHETAVH